MLNSHDMSIHNEGSLVLFRPLSDIGRQWIAENIPEDAPKFGTAICVEPRYAGGIFRGMLEDGLDVEGGAYDA